MRFSFILAVFVATFAFALDAPAVVTKQTVNRMFVSEQPNEFEIKSEERADGLIQFTITRKLSEPRYLVASFIVSDRSSVIAKLDVPAAARDGEATYHISVDADRLPTASFHLAERSFVDSNTGRPVPLAGGTDFKVQLAEFVPEDVKD